MARYRANSPEDTDIFLTKIAKVPKIDMERTNCKRALLFGLFGVAFIVIIRDYFRNNNQNSFHKILCCFNEIVRKSDIEIHCTQNAM